MHLREALAISRAVGARALEGSALMALGRAAWAIDVDSRPAAAWFEDALRILREADEPFGVGWVLIFLAGDQLKVGDLEGAASRATEALAVGTEAELAQVVGESRRVLAIVAARKGQHADARRLFEEAAAAHEQADDRWGLAVVLTVAAHLASNRRDEARALGPLRQALRLARDTGSGERMVFAVALAAYVLHRSGRAREVATLVGALEGVYLRIPRREEQLRPVLLEPAGLTELEPDSGFGGLASLVSAGFESHRVAGRSLSLERAADLALRVLDEELSLVVGTG